jgi:hypothetical protein
MAEAATPTPEATVNEALGLLDKGLGDLLHRKLVSTNEVTDLLLDVRTLLTSITASREQAGATSEDITIDDLLVIAALDFREQYMMPTPPPREEA